MKRSLVLMMLGAALAGCSTVSGWFGSSKAVAPPAALTQFKATAELRTAWQAAVGPAGVYDFDPVAAGDAVFAAGSDGRLVRLDANSGRETWRVDSGKKLSGGVGAGADLVLVGTRKGEVLAYDFSGQPRWTAQLSSEVLVPPAVDGGVVAVRTQDGRVTGLDAADGKRRWVLSRVLPALSVRSHAGIAVASGVFYTGFPGGRLVAIAPANGAVLWEAAVALPRGATELERISDVTGTPVTDGRQVCAATYQGRVACFDLRNGEPNWARDISTADALAIDDVNVYASDDKGTVHAFNKQSGASLWKQEKLSNRRLSAPLVIGRHVAVVDLEGYVHLLSAEDGGFAARAATDGSAVRAAPAPVASGFMVQTVNGGLFAFAVK